VSEIGKRLKYAREAKGLSLRKFADGLGVHYTFIAHIEKGRRFPKEGIKKFAHALSLTPEQLEALIAVEHRGLDPYQMLPEIAPVPVKQMCIEAETREVLNKFTSRREGKFLPEGPIPIEDVITSTSDIRVEEVDFEKEQIAGSGRGVLCGCFYPDGFHGKARSGKGRIVLVNAGKIQGRKLSDAERRVTIAHEVGHYYMHYGEKKSRQLLFHFSKEPTYCRESEIEPEESNLKEYQANVFGACLLMPKAAFLKEWKRVSGDVAELAKSFEVTELFVRLRLKTLNL
jgi:transcriptional regulator with XRE-family HTH domain